MARQQDQNTITTEQIIAYLAKTGKHEYATILAEAQKQRGENAATLIAGIVNDDLQTNLNESGYEATCPKCGSEKVKKDGKRNHLQRYKCRECGSRFTSTSGTFLEKSRYMWDVWQKVLGDLIRGLSINDTTQSLRVDYACSHIQPDTVWGMRMRLLYAIHSLPSPKLTGVIQMDDTFIREGQKNAKELKNPLPATANVERRPRKRNTPSLLGSLGPEFVCATAAVDGDGHCVIRALSQGTPTKLQVLEFIRDNMERITFFATDEDKTYRSVINSLRIPHFIQPSNRLTVLKDNGYITDISKDKELARAQRESNRKIEERLWHQGLDGKIENANATTYKQFCHYRDLYDLTLNGVNGLHDIIADRIGDMRGVNSKYVPLYLSLIQVAYNAQADGIDIRTDKGVGDFLSILVGTRAVWRGETEREWRDGEHTPVLIGDRFTAKLIDETTAVRLATGNEHFKFNGEDPIRYTSKKTLLTGLPVKELKELAKSNGIAVGGKTKSDLAWELMGCEDIDLVIAKSAYRDADGRMDEEDEKYAVERKWRNGEDDVEPYRPNKVVLSQTMPQMMFLANDEAVESPVIFITVKTTGKDYTADEVIGFSAVDEDGNVIIDEKFKTRSGRKWNGKADCPACITPKDTMADGVHHLSSFARTITAILATAGTVVGWNLRFQLDMLHACYVDVPVERKYLDLERRLFPDAKYHNKNKRNQFYAGSQAHLVEAVRAMENKKTYKASKPIDDARYIRRLWLHNLPQGYERDGEFIAPEMPTFTNEEEEGIGLRPVDGLFPTRGFSRLHNAEQPVVFLDIETTGKRGYAEEEVLSVAVISADGEVLYGGYIKPEHHDEWLEAQSINHITPEMVADAPSIGEEAEEIARILNGAGCVMGWYVPFDLKTLYANGVDLVLDGGHYCDLSREYKSWRKKNDVRFAKRKTNLGAAMRYFGLEFPGDPHTAMADAGALIPLREAMLANDPVVSRTNGKNKNAMLNAFGMNTHKTMANA